MIMLAVSIGIDSILHGGTCLEGSLSGLGRRGTGGRARHTGLSRSSATSTCSERQPALASGSHEDRGRTRTATTNRHQRGAGVNHRLEQARRTFDMVDDRLMRESIKNKEQEECDVVAAE